MRSESLMRFGDNTVRLRANEQARAELMRQTEEFLARGGQVEVLPGIGEPGRVRNLGVREQHSGKIVSRPSREVVNGKPVLRPSAIGVLIGKSEPFVRKAWRSDPGFPRPVPGVKPMAWLESDIQRWWAEHE